MNRTMLKNPFHLFEQAETAEQKAELQQIVNEEGYSCFRKLLNGFQDLIKSFQDEEVEHVVTLIHKAKEIFPAPIQFSPGWERVWIQYEQTIQHKIKVLKTVAVDQRDGKWQFLMHNPYTNQAVVCYPNITFLEAAYLYGYFRTDLEPNEYIQIQKVNNIISEFGD